MNELLITIGIYMIGFIITPLVMALLDDTCLKIDGSFNWDDYASLVVMWPFLLVVGIFLLVVGIAVIPFALIARSVDSILKWIKGDQP